MDDPGEANSGNGAVVRIRRSHPTMSCILLLGDAHLRDGDPEVDVFLNFLDSLPTGAVALYLLGDLFDLWVGSSAFTTESHRRVLDAPPPLRAGGLRVGYGGRGPGHHLRPADPGGPFGVIPGRPPGSAF